MDKDVLILLQLLSKKPYITLKEIETSFDITRRQVIYRIEKLNDVLKYKGIPPVMVGSAKEIKIDKKVKSKLESLLIELDSSDEYYMNKKERQIYMYLMLFINPDYLSLQNFISSLRVSRSTVLLDFKELVQILEQNGIQVKNNRSKGYYLVGSEMEIRRMMMRYVIYTLAEEKQSKIFDIIIEDFHLDIFEYSRLVISEIALKFNIHFVENRLVEFIYIYIFLIARIESGKDADEEIKKLVDLDALTSMKEYEFTENLLQNYVRAKNIKQADINYITAWILGISFGDIKEDTNDCILISDIVGKIISRFEYLSGVRYKETEDIFIQLYSHFRPAYYRLLFKLPIFNPLCDKVKEEYHDLYQLMEETMKPFHVIFGEEIPKEEIAYLTLHFAFMYSEKKSINLNRQKKALVVCVNGIGSSAILYNELKEMFPELLFYPPIATSNIKEILEPVDVIFSTTYITHSMNIDIPVIRVTPVMSMSERYQVMREVYMQLGSASLKQPNIDVVMQIIHKHAEVRQESELYDELISYFSHFEEEPGKQESLSLNEMVRKELIRLDVEAKDWQEAIREAYKPMVRTKVITQNYVEDTIRSVKNNGPYIVITKHVALPHTKPEAGANLVALGISVLKNPVNFGSKDNDPVKYIFSLSATDNYIHLNAMAELLELFNKESFFEMLDNARNVDEVKEYLCENRKE